MQRSTTVLLRAALVGAASLPAFLFTACASTNAPGARDPSQSNAAVSASAMAEASPEPINANAATIRVAGLACPKCATNVDVQLTKIPGVRVENIDMKHGLVQVVFEQQPHPSPARLGRAVEDSGLSFLGMHDGPAPVAPLPPANPMISGR